MTDPRNEVAPAGTPDLDRLERALASAAPLFRDTIARTRRELGPAWERATDETARRLFPGDAELTAAVQGYSRFAADVLRRQLRFERTRVYEPKSYEEATREVYANEQYMRTQYLPGLLLSHHLWPHHHRQHAFFETAFVSEMRRRGASRFHDVGVGTGFYSRSALTSLPGVQGVAFDISPSSKSFSEWHVAAFGAGDRFRVELRDVVASPPEPVEWLISVEVLEHLEDPLVFLRALRKVLAPGGKAFITTALNAPNSDHIYLYRNASEVSDHLEAAGFATEQYLCALSAKPSAPGVPVAAVIAFVVS